MNQSGTRTSQAAVRAMDSHVSCDAPSPHTSGETALTSGIYSAAHPATNGKHAGEVVIIKGSQFPSCRRCGESLEFCLVQSAVHISEDEDFITGNTDVLEKAKFPDRE